MAYTDILQAAVKESGWSYTQIALRCKRYGVYIDKSLISKLCNGKKNPTDEINHVLAEVLQPVVPSISFQRLQLATYKDVIPQSVLDLLRDEWEQEYLQQRGCSDESKHQCQGIN